MMFWVFAALITLVVAVSLIAALRGGRDRVMTGALSDISVYKDQLAEVDRDLARGVLTEAEADAVRTEVSRRLLEADKRAAEDKVSATATLPAVVAVMVVLIGGGALLYQQIGAAGYPDLPMAQRLADIDAAAANRMGQVAAEAQAAPNMPDLPQGDAQFMDLMEKLRATVEARPDDLRGLGLLAENEAKLGNFAAAREAQTRVLEIKGDAADEIDLLTAIDIMVFGAGGYVSPEAEALIRRLVQIAPESGAGRYYAGLTMAQNGRPDQAFPIWRRLLESSPPQAPWVPVIRAEIGGIAAAAGINYTPPAVSGPSAADIAAAQDLSDEDRLVMIQGMVDGLAARLASEGGTPEEWARLISALGVLGETERASAILGEARTVFAESAEAIALIEGAAAQAGLQ